VIAVLTAVVAAMVPRIVLVRRQAPAE